MNTLEELKQTSGATRFVSVFGKSFVPLESDEYKLVTDVVRLLMSKGMGIIHGGYAGGMMSAAGDAAHAYLVEHNLPLERNIGVPQKQFETYARVSNASFTEIAEDHFDRLRLVTSGDIAVIAPIGGDGTEVEETIMFHENLVRIQLGFKPVPMIFLETPNGTPWKKLLEMKRESLATSMRDIHAIEWVYFADSLVVFEKILKKITVV